MKKLSSLLALLVVAQIGFAEEIEPSVSLWSYYATTDAKSGDAVRMALFDVIKDHTSIGYKQLGIIMQWSDTEGADGQNVVDIYTSCPYTVSGPITWSNASSLGGGLNREHTVPQSWFNENEPMRSDVFHVYPTDCKANSNRASFLYGECPNGTSTSTSKCAETGKKGSSEWTGTTSYSGTVYEPADEYKGDLARSYFYMATRYADVCADWSGGAFGSDANGLGAYTTELMLKWHRQDPVSEKEMIRNEVIYGNPEYNKSDKKQGNRNPFIDFPDLVEYIWGDKQEQMVALSALETPYSTTYDEAIEIIRGQGTSAHKILINGHLFIQLDEQIYTVTGQRIQ